MAQPSLRNFGCLLPNPPLKGWASLESPLREMSVGNSSSDTTAHGRKMSKLYKLYAPLGIEFSCPDTEIISLKTKENNRLRLSFHSRTERNMAFSWEFFRTKSLTALRSPVHSLARRSKREQSRFKIRFSH